MKESSGKSKTNSEIRIPINSITLEGNLIISEGAKGIVVFAHGSGSSRHSSRINMLHGNFRKKALEHCYLIY